MSAENSDNGDYPSLENNYRGHKSIVTGVSFSPDNKQLVTSSHDHCVFLWNLASKTAYCYNFVGHTDAVTSVDFSPDGQLIASASLDRTVRLWMPTIRGKCTEFRAHSSAVRTIAFSNDGLKLVTGSNDKVVKLWEVRRRKFVTSFSAHTNWVRCAKFSPSNELIASCSDDRTLRLWDVKSGQCVHTFTHLKGSGTHLDFHPSGTAVALAMNNGGVRVYDIGARKLRQHYVLHDSTTCVSWHPAGNHLLSSGADAALRVVDVLEGRPIYTLKSHEAAVNAAVFSKDGQYFATGSTDRHVMVWKTNFVKECSDRSDASA